MTSDRSSPPGPDDTNAAPPMMAPDAASVQAGSLGDPSTQAGSLGDPSTQAGSLREPSTQAGSLREPSTPGPQGTPDRAAEEGGAGVASPPALPVDRPKYLFLAAVALLSLAADLGSKEWARARLDDTKSFDNRDIEVIPNLVSFIFARNKGGAWGLLQDQPEVIRRPFFLAISVLAIGFIVSLYRHLSPQQTALKWGLPLVLGGALGNLVNRLQYNYVIDFIDVYITRGGKEHHWPTFNVADVAICVGVGLMAVDMFTSRRSSTQRT